MSSKGNGEGSVYYNKQRKKWNAQYKEYDTETGKMKYKTKSFKTENEAKKYLNVILSKFDLSGRKSDIDKLIEVANA